MCYPAGVEVLASVVALEVYFVKNQAGPGGPLLGE